MLGVHWKDWCWSWNSSTLATWCEELTHWKRPWCWEGLGAGGEEDDRGWDGWMASPTLWEWVCINSGSWWWTERSGMLRFMGLQRVRHNWTTELNWTDITDQIESDCNAGDLGLIPGSGRSSGEENGNSLQYSHLENPVDRGAWQAAVHGIPRVGHDLAIKPPPIYIGSILYCRIFS